MSDLPLDEKALDCAVAAHANETVLVMLRRRSEAEAMATAISTYLREAGFECVSSREWDDIFVCIKTPWRQLEDDEPLAHKFRRQQDELRERSASCKEAAAQIGEAMSDLPVVQAESEELSKEASHDWSTWKDDPAGVYRVCGRCGKQETRPEG